MANSLLTPDVVAPASLALLENSLVLSNKVYRDLESEFDESKIGDTIQIRRPMQYTVRTGATAAVQDSVEGKTTLVVDTQKGVDIQFSSKELTLDVDKFAERHLKPAMIRLANDIDSTLYQASYKATYNWVGTPGQLVNSYTDFIKAPQRLDEMAVPTDERIAIFSPADYWAMVGGFGNGANFNQPELSKTAIQKARLPMLGNVDAYQSQIVSTHTVGALGGTPAVNAASSVSTWANVKDTYAQDLVTDGWTAAVATRVKKGDVFTIAGVYAVNPVTKDTQSFLQQFVAQADAASDGSGNMTISISPPIIASGAYQTVSAGPADGDLLTFVGSASTGYTQNLVFHPNAFALACVPLALPGGAASKSRYTKNGFSIRVVESYDSTNDLNFWRFDVLFGVKAIDPRLATRLSGTA